MKPDKASKKSRDETRLGHFARSRGIDDMIEKFGPGAFEEALAATLRRGGRPRVVEIGCGEGVVLLELLKRHPQLELHGINKRPWEAFEGRQSLPAVAKINGLFDDKELKALELPQIHFYDAHRLHFEDASVDLAISQVAIPYVMKKHELLAETWRVLKPGGRALLNIDTTLPETPDFLPGETPRFLIYREGALLPFADWIAERAERGFDVRAFRVPDAKGRKTWTHLAMTKNREEPLPIELELDPLSTFNLRVFLDKKKPEPMTWGCRSVFRSPAR